MSLLTDLDAAISKELSMLVWADTPYVYDLVHERHRRDEIRETIKTKVIAENIDIYEAIIRIDNELNPNHID